MHTPLPSGPLGPTPSAQRHLPQHRVLEGGPDGDIEVEDCAPPRRSLRVALVTETYPPEVNGVAATIARVVQGLREREHRVQLVRLRQNAADDAQREPRFDEVLMRGLPIPRYPQLKMGLPSRKALLKLWTAQRPDVVHLVTEGPLGWSALQAATQLRLPVVSDFRTNFHAYSRHYGIGWLRAPLLAYLRRFHNRTACTMVPTAALHRELAAAGFQGLRTVARGVDARRFDPARRSAALRASWGAGPSTMVVLYVGRLAAEKNLGTLLAAAEAMREHDRELQFVLVGDGPERERLHARAPWARFVGTKRDEELAAHYASADVFLFPSLTETWGNVVTEAMASGLAVVAHSCAAAAQLIRDGENGLLVRHEDADGFVRAARRLAGDSTVARRLGDQARATALGLDWDRIVNEVVVEYEAAMAAPALRARTAWAPALPSV